MRLEKILNKGSGFDRAFFSGEENPPYSESPRIVERCLSIVSNNES